MAHNKHIIASASVALRCITLATSVSCRDALISLFSHSHSQVASKLCFNSPVYLSYTEVPGDLVLLKLEKKNDFSFEESEKVLNICRHSFSISPIIVAEFLEVAAANLLCGQDKVFCYVGGKLSCYLSLSGGELLEICFVNPDYQCQRSNNVANLIESFQDRVLGCTQGRNGVEIFGCKGMAVTIRLCLEVLLFHSLIDADEIDSIYNRLTFLSYKECVMNEHEKLLRIASSECFGELDGSVEFFTNLLAKMADNPVSLTQDERDVITKVVRREGEYKQVPEIVSRCFTKIRKNFVGCIIQP